MENDGGKAINQMALFHYLIPSDIDVHHLLNEK